MSTDDGMEPGGAQPVAEPSRDFLRAGSAWGIYARLLVAILGFPLAYYAAPHGPILHSCLAVYLCLALVALAIYRRRTRPKLRLAFSGFGDLVAVNLAVWAFGSGVTVFPAFYALLVCLYTVRGGSRIGLIMLLSAIGSYLAIIVCESNAWLPVAPLGYANVHLYMTQIGRQASFILVSIVLVACYMFLNGTVGRLRSSAETAHVLWTTERRTRAHSEDLQKKLDQAARLESLGRLTGGIAHDFNNMLTSILGYTRFAQEGLPAAAQARSDLDAVIAVSERAAVLTAQLLAFSRNQIVNAARIDVNALVSKSTTTLGRLLGEDIRIEVELTDEPTIIVADPTQIEQVLLTLAVNSRDALPDGGSLRLSTEVVEVDSASSADRVSTPPGEYVRLTVTDTGTGIAPEHLARVFEPFFTTKEPGKGSGMGLAATYGWVKQNDGTIDVESVVGEGTTFALLFPCALDGAAGVGRVTPVPGSGRTILVVEDDADVRRLACRMLLRDGYQVLEAADGQRAINLAAQHDGPIHLLLTDVIMPGLTGKSLAQQLHADRPELVVVYMSGYTDDVMERHGLREQQVEIVAKPFDSGSLLDSVRRALRPKN